MIGAAGLFACAVLCVHLVFPHVRTPPLELTEADVTCERIDKFAEACEAYQRFAGTWPTSVACVRAVVPLNDTNIFFDGWGREINMRFYKDAPNALWLISYGADGLPGGSGAAADILEALDSGAPAKMAKQTAVGRSRKPGPSRTVGPN